MGSYTATRILVIAAGDTTDVLAEGGSLTLTLEGSAQVRGRLVAPGQGPAGADLDEDMAGAWTFVITSRTVRISQQAATFVRDATFRPARIDDGVGLELTASIAGDAFTGAPAVELRLIRS